MRIWLLIEDIINDLANDVIANDIIGATINFDSFTHAILILKVGTRCCR